MQSYEVSRNQPPTAPAPPFSLTQPTASPMHGSPHVTAVNMPLSNKFVISTAIMSYGQPPSRNAYGDQDFIKEDFGSPMQPFTTSQPNSGLPQSPYVRPNSAYSPNAPYSTPAPPEPTTYNMQQSPLTGQQLSARQHQQQDPQLKADANSYRDLLSLTPEDQIFMQSWRRDALLYRAVPLTLASNAALFFFNQSRGLPHKPGRYLSVALGAYVLGRYSYTGELKRRLEANPSNTPFIKKMREITGVKTSFSELDGTPAQDYSGFSASSDVSQQLGAGFTTIRPSQASPYDQTPSYQPYESDLPLPPAANDGTAKKMTSYEELRARNRGYTQK